MANVIFLSDIIESNGKTVRENNLVIKHKFPIGSLVEYDWGLRMFVCGHERDCDGSVLYALTWDMGYANDYNTIHAMGEPERLIEREE